MGAEMDSKDAPVVRISGELEHGTTQQIIIDVAEDHTVRKLKPRHIQLIGIAGTIGSL